MSQKNCIEFCKWLQGYLSAIDPITLTVSQLVRLREKLNNVRMDDVVIIEQETYDELLEDSEFLQALKSVGVDSWEGYSQAQDLISDSEED